VAVWLSGNKLALINVVALRRARLDLRVGSSKSTWVDLGLPSGVKSVCSSITVEILWRRRSHYKSFQVDLTNNREVVNSFYDSIFLHYI